jgi:hypothetical protein
MEFFHIEGPFGFHIFSNLEAYGSHQMTFLDLLSIGSRGIVLTGHKVKNWGAPAKAWKN